MTIFSHAPELAKVKHFISLGAGVQSSTMALMAAHGEITPMPEAAIFADTRAEPKKVYEWLDWLEKQLPFPVVRVSKGNLRNDELRIARSKKTGRLYRKNSIPAFILKPKGKVGLLGRKCTIDYKIDPVRRKVKELLGIRRAKKVRLAIMWIGISSDEFHRMKDSQVAYLENRWPLVDLGMSREDCLKWMASNSFPEPPRSACTFCPFHSDYEWAKLKAESPTEFSDVVKFESELQLAGRAQEVLEGTPYLHGSCKPIGEIDFSRDGPGYEQINLFGNECEGMCGV